MQNLIVILTIIFYLFRLCYGYNKILFNELSSQTSQDEFKSSKFCNHSADSILNKQMEIEWKVDQLQKNVDYILNNFYSCMIDDDLNQGLQLIIYSIYFT